MPGFFVFCRLDENNGGFPTGIRTTRPLVHVSCRRLALTSKRLLYEHKHVLESLL